MQSKSKTYFRGLNTLRFFAASFVVIQHIQDNQFTQGLPHLPELPLLNKGVPAVTFFFTLSGFLITYLLLQEYKNYSSISISNFYVRRILRIWPLYFLIVLIGLSCYWILFPQFGIPSKNDYPFWQALIYYLTMLPNLANQLFSVGGILIILWSIGVEEQFYLIWAPIIKVFKSNIRNVLILVFIVSFSIHMMNHYGLFAISESWQMFISELQFQYMAAGGIFAYLLFQSRAQLLSNFIFTNKIIQCVLLGIISIYFLVIPTEWINEFVKAGLAPFLFSWLIVNISTNERSVIKLNNKILNRFGELSYGIYMYHMLIIYGVSFLFLKHVILIDNSLLFQAAYHILVFALSITLSHLSYHHFEKRFLSKRKNFSEPKTKKTQSVAQQSLIKLKSYDTI